MDDALEMLQQHYRAVHPTKAFYRNRECESLEQYNLDVEEVFENHNLARAEADPQYDWRQLRATVTNWKRQAEMYGVSYMNPNTVAEVERRVEEHYANQPAPDVAVNVWGDGVAAAAPRPFDPAEAALEVEVADPIVDGF